MGAKFTGITYLNTDFDINDTTAKSIGQLPAGAVVVDAFIVVTTVFDATGPVIDLGTTANPDGFATDLAGGVIGKIVADELATSNDLEIGTATQAVVTYGETSGGTVGAGWAFVGYVIPNVS